MVAGLLHRFGFRGWYFHASALGSIALCITLWIRAKTVDQVERGNAERRALFAGLWAPTLWGIGSSVELREGRGGRRGLVRRSG